MIRERNSFYYRDGIETQIRGKKSSEKLKEFEKMKLAEKISEKIFKEHGSIAPVNLHLDNNILKKANEKRPSMLRRKCKHMSQDKLMKLILGYIIETDHDSITKEDLAILFQTRNCKVEQIFQLLNLKGVLSQRRPYYAHDTNRNPMFSGNSSGWASDFYSIIDKEKAKKLYAEN